MSEIPKWVMIPSHALPSPVDLATELQRERLLAGCSREYVLNEYSPLLERHRYIRFWLNVRGAVNKDEFLEWEQRDFEFSMNKYEEKQKTGKIEYFDPKSYSSPPKPVLSSDIGELQPAGLEKVKSDGRFITLDCFSAPLARKNGPLRGTWAISYVGREQLGSVRERTIRGWQVERSISRVRTHACMQVFTEDGGVAPYYFWGGIPLAAYQSSAPHRLIVGSVGSGKSLMLRCAMRGLLPVPKGADQSLYPAARSLTRRAVVYDAKSDEYEGLIKEGFDPKESLFSFGPGADRVCWAWDVAKDVGQGPEAFDEVKDFASMLVPKHKNSGENSEFWHNCTVKVISAIVVALITAAKKKGIEQPNWTLMDVISACYTERELHRFLSEHDPNWENLSAVIAEEGNKDTAKNVFASIQSRLESLIPLALHWKKAALSGRSKSLREFVEDGEGEILLLPNTTANPTVMKPINELLMRVLERYLLSRKINPHNEKEQYGPLNYAYTQIVFDELPSAGNIKSILELTTIGRDFGVEVTIGFQDIETGIETFGEKLWNSILAQCPNRTILRCYDKTSEWAEKVLGKSLVEVKKKAFSSTNSFGYSENTARGSGISVGPGGTNLSSNQTHGSAWNAGKNESETESTELRLDPVVLANQFQSMPDIRRQKMLAGVFTVSGSEYPIWHGRFGLEEVLAYAYKETTHVHLEDYGDDSREEWVIPIDVSYKWTSEDRVRLCLAEEKADYKSLSFDW